MWKCISVLVYLLASTNLCFAQQLTPAQQQFALLSRLAGYNVTANDYLLECAKIDKTTARDLEKTLESYQEEFRSITDEIKEATTVEAKKTSLQKLRDLTPLHYEKLTTVLTAEQIKALQFALAQRGLLKHSNAESFQFPLLVLEQLELTQLQKQELMKSMEEISREFYARRTRLYEECFQALRAELPDDIFQTHEALANGQFQRLISETNLDERLEPAVAADQRKRWTAADFDAFEDLVVQRFIFAMLHNEGIQEQLAIAPAQRQNLQDEYDRWNKELMPDEDEKLTIQQLAKQRQELRDVRLPEHLSDSQLLLLDLVAQYYRGKWEHPEMAEFAVLLPLIDALPIEASRKSELTATVKQLGRRYGKEITKIREETAEMALDALPKEARQRLEAAYGKRLYDYQGERLPR